jgi:hypothetical protein
MTFKPVFIFLWRVYDMYFPRFVRELAVLSYEEGKFVPFMSVSSMKSIGADNFDEHDQFAYVSFFNFFGISTEPKFSSEIFEYNQVKDVIDKA